MVRNALLVPVLVVLESVRCFGEIAIRTVRESTRSPLSGFLVRMKVCTVAYGVVTVAGVAYDLGDVKVIAARKTFCFVLLDRTLFLKSSFFYAPYRGCEIRSRIHGEGYD